MNSLSYEEMVKAMTECDSQYDGKFYPGVMTTGIYCLPSCKAKLPNIENVVFFTYREEAIAFGLRGCKRCKSDSYPNVIPKWLPAVIDHMKYNRIRKLDENILTEMSGTDISTIRRYFREHVGISPMAFHRKLRLKHSKLLLESGHDYFSAGYNIGYESSSGFREAFKKEFGRSPGSLIDGK